MFASILQRAKNLTQLLPAVVPSLIPAAPSFVPVRNKNWHTHSTKPTVRYLKKRHRTPKKFQIPVEQNNVRLIFMLLNICLYNITVTTLNCASSKLLKAGV